MSFVNIPERTTDDANSFADINQLQENIRVLGGNGADVPTSDITTLKTDVSGLQSYIYAKTHIHQIKQTHSINVENYTTSATRVLAVEISALTTTITTTQADSKVAIDIVMSAEADENTVFFLERVIDEVVTEIGSATAQGVNRPYGMTGQGYDSNRESTPNQMIFQYVDEPAQASGTVISYRIKAYNKYTSGAIVHLNHSISDTDEATRERLTSNFRLTEFGGTPIIIDSVTSIIATTAEAIAGTNDVNIVTPLKLREGLNATGDAPVYACRAWVHYNGSTTRYGYGNISSITDDGTGLTTVHFTTAMPDANYSVVAAGRRSVDVGGAEASPQISISNFTTASFKVGTQDNNSDTYSESSNICIAVFR